MQQIQQHSQDEEEPNAEDAQAQVASSSEAPLMPGPFSGRQESLQALTTVFQAALQVAQAAQHTSQGPQPSLPPLPLKKSICAQRSELSCQFQEEQL